MVVGNASDAPQLLHDLASSDKEVWSSALVCLRHYYSHYYGAYSGTPVLVPFLIELVTSPHVHVHVRSSILYLLFIFTQLKPKDDPNVVLTSAAIAQGVEVFLQLVGDTDPIIRRSAVHPLDGLPDQRAIVVPAIRQRLQGETDDLVQARLLRYLDHHDPTFFADDAVITTYVLQKEPNALSRMITVVASIHAKQENSHPVIIRALLDLFKYVEDIAPHYIESDMSSTETVVEKFCHCCRLLPLSMSDEMVPFLLQRFHDLHDLYDMAG